MLSPRIHTMHQLRSLTMFTARHDWRMPETGMVFSVAGHSYQTVAIVPRNPVQGLHRAKVLIRQLNTGRMFGESLDAFWAGLDRGVFGSAYSNLFVSWEPLWVKKSIARHARKVQKARQRVRRFLVQEGLVVAS